MAELIVTDEEKAANSYLDWDDASLGRFAKYTALTLQKLSDDSEGLRKLTAASCAMMLISNAFDSNAATLKLTMEGHTHAGAHTGDWTVTVKRIRKPIALALKDGEEG